jgi:hypothetical protein
MTIPTRLIEKAEFDELQRAEGDTLILHKLTALPFDPPRPDGQAQTKVKHREMNVLLMNVSDPVIYKEKDTKMVFIIMNGYDDASTFTYENFQDCHIEKGAWCYRLAPNYWSERDTQNFDLDDAIYVFNHFDREEQGLDQT